MKRNPFPPIFTALFALLLAVPYLFPGFGFDFFKSLDDRWYDVLFRFRGMQASDHRVVVVAIDDESLKKVGQYPWPRRQYETLLNGLFAEGVRVVGLDIMFLDHSNREDDAALVRATRKWRDRVVFAISRDPEVSEEIRFLYPFDALRKEARFFGSVTQSWMDNDGSVRATPLVVGSRDGGDAAEWVTDPKRVHSLGAATLGVYEGRSPDDYVRRAGPILVLNTRGEEEQVVGTVVSGGETVPLVRKVYGVKRVPAWRVLKGELRPEDRGRLKGAIVLVGSTALGAYDHYPTAFSSTTPGVEVHANVIDNLLNERWLRRIPVKPVAALIIIFSFLGWWTVGLRPLWSGIVSTGLFISWVVVSFASFEGLRLLDFSAPTLALLGTFVVLITHKTMQEHRRRKEVQQMFGQCLAPEVVKMLVRDPSLLRLGGEKRDMTAFFLDIAHFTNISEKLSPEALIQFLNRYLTALSDIVLKNGGYVDKYIGDCVMAFWNAPLDVPNHRAQACLTAVECIQAVEHLNAEHLDPNISERPAVRIGLNAGTMVVGFTGSSKKFNYTILGDEVNLSSRLEGANKYFGSHVMVSESVYQEGRKVVEGRFLGSIRVVGKDVPVRVYELLAKKGELSPAWAKAVPLFEDGVAAFLRREFEPARGLFKQVLEILPGDKPSEFYLRNCAEHLAWPPAPDWDGVFNLTEK